MTRRGWVAWVVIAVVACGAAGSGEDERPGTGTGTGSESGTGSDRDTDTDTATATDTATDTDTTARVVRTFRGKASYYADSLHGRPTASGEPYDKNALTAAHRTLPFGTRIRVIRLDTGASVIVRINDRGPFGRRRRVVDLSRAAAERLDMIRAGVIDVRVEVLSE